MERAQSKPDELLLAARVAETLSKIKVDTLSVTTSAHLWSNERQLSGSAQPRPSTPLTWHRVL